MLSLSILIHLSVTRVAVDCVECITLGYIVDPVVNTTQHLGEISLSLSNIVDAEEALAHLDITREVKSFVVALSSLLGGVLSTPPKMK